MPNNAVLKPAPEKGWLEKMLIQFYPDLAEKMAEEQAFGTLAYGGDKYALNDPRAAANLLLAGDPKAGAGRLVASKAGAQGPTFEMMPEGSKMGEMMRVAREAQAAKPVRQIAPELQSEIDSVATQQLANIQKGQALKDAANRASRMRQGRQLSRELKESLKPKPQPKAEESMLSKLRGLFRR